MPVRAWTKQTKEQVARSHDQNAGAPCCCLRGTLSLHLLAEDAQGASGSDAPSLVQAGAGTALCSSEQHQGCPLPWVRYDCTGAVTPLDPHFLKEPRHPRVAVRSLNTLQPHVYRFDSGASLLMSVKLLQLYRSAKEHPVKLTMFKAKRLG